MATCLIELVVVGAAEAALFVPCFLHGFFGQFFGHFRDQRFGGEHQGCHGHAVFERIDRHLPQERFRRIHKEKAFEAATRQ